MFLRSCLRSLPRRARATLWCSCYALVLCNLDSELRAVLHRWTFRLGGGNNKMKSEHGEILGPQVAAVTHVGKHVALPYTTSSRRVVNKPPVVIGRDKSSEIYKGMVSSLGIWFGFNSEILTLPSSMFEEPLDHRSRLPPLTPMRLQEDVFTSTEGL